ncbi:MAG: TIR domain-containing protein [Chloroflexales bacterium]|nr:TIR domain-containing protein [Chloroflexales bacterium]
MKSIQPDLSSRLGFRPTLQMRKHEGTIYSLDWSSDGRLLASASQDRTIWIWDAERGKELVQLTGHSEAVRCVAWSRSYARLLASGSDDKTVRLWDLRSAQAVRTLQPHDAAVSSIAWSPDATQVATGSWDTFVRIWDLRTGKLARKIPGHLGSVHCIAWAPDGSTLASCADDGVRFWNVHTGQHVRSVEGHSSRVRGLTWSPDGSLLASCADDMTIRLWDTRTGRETRVFEGHSGAVYGVTFSDDGRFLASKSSDGTIRIWRMATWETVDILPELQQRDQVPDWLEMRPSSGPVFQRRGGHQTLLATIGDNEAAICLWPLDLDHLSRAQPVDGTAHYRNAKVVLVGNTGVGKSGLAMALCGGEFATTVSTHGRKVLVFSNYTALLENGQKEVREILLWDLAGQPGYRLVHQLHLNQTSAALLVVDSQNDVDPFASVRYWDRALRQAERIQGHDALPIKKYMVAARVDRGGLSVSETRIKDLMNTLGFQRYFKTSAKEGWGISELAIEIEKAIDWDDAKPARSSTTLFQSIQQFVRKQRNLGLRLVSADELYLRFRESNPDLREHAQERQLFDAGIELAEQQNLVRQLTFNNLVLLEPELLDAYASALINTARDEPDGLGSITEDKARRGDIRMSDDERIEKSNEHLLIIATIEQMVYHEVVLREQGDEGPLLVFPSELTQERQDLPEPEGKAVIFTFEGALLNIYATLVVRLTHSGVFQKKQLWKNAATYAKLGGEYGMYMDQIEEGRGELTLFFSADATDEMRTVFEEYVHRHLQRRALVDSVKRRRVFSCDQCRTIITEQMVDLRRQRGYNWIDCPVCEPSSRISLDERPSRPRRYAEVVQDMDREAEVRRDRERVAAILAGKKAADNFDVYLCYSMADRQDVMDIADQLCERGILPWLDEWALRPGQSLTEMLQLQLPRMRSAAVFFGAAGLDSRQRSEIDILLNELARRGLPVIPVILSSAPTGFQLPMFLQGMNSVDFRRVRPEPIEQLYYGITGERRQRY